MGFLLVLMEWACVLITLTLFASGILPSLELYKTGDTRNFPFLLFLLSVLSCEGMFHYGMIKDNPTMIVVNFIGMALNLGYVLLFLHMEKGKTDAFKWTCMGASYIVLLHFLCYIILDEDRHVRSVLGHSGNLTTIAMLVVPIAIELVENLKNKNSDGMPVPMLILSLATSVSWLIYGLMLGDPNVYSSRSALLPNIPGILIVFAKFYVMSIYPRSEMGEQPADKQQQPQQQQPAEQPAEQPADASQDETKPEEQPAAVPEPQPQPVAVGGDKPKTE